VNGIQALRMQLQKYEPGDVVTLTILRDGEEIQLEVTLGERS
jgi:S1-C subfamily serine protease